MPGNAAGVVALVELSHRSYLPRTIGQQVTFTHWSEWEQVTAVEFRNGAVIWMPLEHATTTGRYRSSPATYDGRNLVRVRVREGWGG